MKLYTAEIKVRGHWQFIPAAPFPTFDGHEKGEVAYFTAEYLAMDAAKMNSEGEEIRVNCVEVGE